MFYCSRHTYGHQNSYGGCLTLDWFLSFMKCVVACLSLLFYVIKSGDNWCSLVQLKSLFPNFPRRNMHYCDSSIWKLAFTSLGLSMWSQFCYRLLIVLIRELLAMSCILLKQNEVKCDRLVCDLSFLQLAAKFSKHPQEY